VPEQWIVVRGKARGGAIVVTMVTTSNAASRRETRSGASESSVIQATRRYF
jgi:hypothetical protein